MSYKMNPEIWNGVFAVPDTIVDDHIKLAGTVQLKVILWILRHSGEEYDPQILSKALGQAVPDINDALYYWIDRGIIKESTSGSETVKLKVSESIDEEKKVRTAGALKKTNEVNIPQMKPTIQDIARRAGENPELKFLFSEAQTQFKRTLSSSEQSNILYIYDYFGLPAEVITMMFEYLSFSKKLTMNNVLKTAEKWAELEIFSLEKAENLLKKARETDNNWKEISLMFGIESRKPTKKEQEYIYSWCDEWNFSKEMIFLAYEENLNKTAKLSFAYINGILKKWNQNGIKNPEDVEMHRKNFRQSHPVQQTARKEQPKHETKASYDLKAYDNMLKKGRLAEKYSHLIKDEDGEN